ncbi:TonB-dependent receptor domain-containing protein [Motilimonas pumila]|uniref:Vitamin B12 transporter BtuB n=1 Tax=Motilimonas pumila TaxID=2303987 RepID=A0A418YAP5_9GAMM|nr:TonB-dependent receptor [Motilimonas pumila]RJG40033.1 TonB-dependent receptor [Motilimonas pumila]
MKKTILAMAIAPLCLSANVFAQDTVVVTASRVAQPIQNTLAPVAVVDKAEIESIQAKSIADVLKRLPGVQVNQGGYGQVTEIYVRGASSRHILVLIDGVRIGSATLGSADFSQIPLTGIERIEFIRGPRASVYGSDAVGGVINVITSYQGEEGGKVAVGAGSHDYQNVDAAVAAEIDGSAWVKLAARHEKADGYSAFKKPEGDDGSWDQSDQADKDGFKNTNIVAEMGKHFTPELSAKVQGYWQKGESDYDSAWSTGTYTEKELYNIAGKLTFDNDAIFSELTLATNRDQGDDYSDSSHNQITTKRTLANWLVSGEVTNGFALTGGLEWFEDKVDNESSQYDKTKRDNKAVYVNADYRVNAFTTEASVRVDDNESYGNEATWQLALGYQLTQELNLIAAAGTAFKAPTFNDLYWPGSGNPDLKPEDSFSYELALAGDYELVGFRVGGYISDIDNLIAWADRGDGVWVPMNVNKADIKGIETSAFFATGPVNHELSYDYVDAKDDETGKRLVRRSEHLAKWNLNYQWQQAEFDLSTIYQSDAYDDAANTVKVDGFVTVDFAASYYFNNGIVIRGQVANLFDEDYEPKAGYNGAERAFYGTLAYQF